MRLERVREQAVAGARAPRAPARGRCEVLEQQAAADADLASEEERPEDRIAAIERELARRSTPGASSAWRASSAGLERELESARVERRASCEQAAAERRSAARGGRAGGGGRARGAPRGRARRRGRTGAGRGGGRRARRGEPVRAQQRRRAAMARRARWLQRACTSSRGYELALAAVLGPRLTAAVVDDRGRGRARARRRRRERRKRPA